MRRPARVIVILGLAIAACGDSGDVGTSEAPETPTTIDVPPATIDAPTTTIDAPTTTIDVPPTTIDAPATTVTTAPTTTETIVTTTEPPTEPPIEERAGCRRVDDFDVDDARWFIVNDGVMGGRSDGRLEIGGSLLRFRGTIVTAGGGFTSVRLRLDDGELAGSDRIELRVRADDRVYGLTYEDEATVQGRSVSHRADLLIDGPVDDDGFQVASLAHADLRPSIFGRAVDAPPFDPDAAREIGIIIADGLDGDFALDIDWIDACN